MKYAGVVVVFLSGCISPVMQFGSGKTAKQAQRAQLSKLMPPPIVADEEGGPGSVGVAKIRVWADETYRAQNVSWQQTFQRELDVANDVLAAGFGIRLEADLRPWSYAAPTGANLTEVLSALRQHDPGDDVLTVIALTSSLSLVSHSFEQLGYASLPGRHIVLRGFADREERRAWDPFFKDVTAEERTQLYAARRQHKTTALLLHELGHNLGADHVEAADTIMNGTYSHTSASFDPKSRATIQASLDRYLKRPPRVKANPGAPPPEKPKALVIVVEEDGRKLVHGAVITTTILDGRLSMAAQDHVGVTVQARRSAPQQIVTELVERARAAGLQVTVETID